MNSGGHLGGRGDAIFPNAGKNKRLLFENNRNEQCFLAETIASSPIFV